MNPHPKARNMKNRYAARAKLTEQELRSVVRLFAKDKDPGLIAHAAGVTRTTVNEYLRKIRLSLAEQSVLDAAMDGTEGAGMIFSVHPFSRAARAKQIAAAPREKGFPREVMRGLLLESRRVSLEILPGLDQEALKLIRKGRMLVFGWKNEECVQRLRLEVELDFQSQDQEELLAEIASSGKKAEESLTAFLAYLRSRVVRLRGVPADTARLHFKEAEYRFNTALTGGCLSRRILAILRERPLG